MSDLRWNEDMEEVMELLFRIQADHGGTLSKSEAQQMGPWVADAAKRAERMWWLVTKEEPPVFKVTYGGQKALASALTSRETASSEPHWFGGSIASVSSETGPVLPAQSYRPYEDLKQWATEQGLLTQEDIDRIASSPRQEPQEPEEYRMLDELSFPGTRVFAGALIFENDHPFGGGTLNPTGHEGPYQVTVTLTRRGAPDISFAYVTDAHMMEGDSHLWPPHVQREDGALAVPLLIYGTEGGGTVQFQLLANQQGRLGQISTVLRADDSGDARRKAYRILNPFLCDLSYRYDVPIEVLQMNVAEIATYTLSGMKQDDFREKVFDLGQFLGPGLNYEELPNYEFFTRLYREGANSSSVDYGFLCFFRIAEGVILLRRKRTIEQEGKAAEEVPRSSILSEREIVDGEGADLFPSELQGKSLWEAYKYLEKQRNKVGHAFLYHEDPIEGHADIIAERLEDEERAATRRAQTRYLARRMLNSEFWSSNEENVE